MDAITNQDQAPGAVPQKRIEPIVINWVRGHLLRRVQAELVMWFSLSPVSRQSRQAPISETKAETRFQKSKYKPNYYNQALYAPSKRFPQT